MCFPAIDPKERIPAATRNVVPNPSLVRYQGNTILLVVTHKVVCVTRSPVGKCQRITYKKIMYILYIYLDLNMYKQMC